MTVDPDNQAKLAAATLEKIEEVCLRFERELLAGANPQIEDHLGSSTGQHRAILVSELIVLDIDYRERAGQTVAIDNYLSRFPYHADTIRQLMITAPNRDADETSVPQNTVSQNAVSQNAVSQRMKKEDWTPPPVVGRYKIIRKIGSGSFADAYLARDDQLQRDVAIKFAHRPDSSSQEKDLFLKEARTLAKLCHPAIVPVFDVGFIRDSQSSLSPACYIVSQYMPGGNLAQHVSRGKPLISDSVSFVIRIADALHYAHNHGVVHRDVKLSNILIDGQGDVFIADFGLALPDEEVGTGRKFAGTPANMSPEQARGDGHLVDGRTDVYGLGVVLYELLTGASPFTGINVAVILEQIQKRDAKPLRQIDDQIPVELERICLKALSKQPADRYTTAMDMGNDLRAAHSNDPAIGRVPQKGMTGWIFGLLAASLLAMIGWANLGSSSNSPASDIRSIAVLPLRPLNDSDDEKYLGLGIADATITRLGNIRQIEVRSTSAIRHLADSDPKSAGDSLNVQAILEGTLQQHSGKTRATVRLIRVSDGSSLWSGTFDDASADIFAIQDSIAENVTRVLALKLTPEEHLRVSRRETENLEAYESYLKGRYNWNLRTGSSLKKSIELYKDAIELDPLYALAWSGLAESYVLLNLYSDQTDEAVFPMGKAAAEMALKLDEGLTEAHATLAYINHYYDRNQEKAETEFQRAIELDPDYPTAHQWYGEYLYTMGRFEESKQELERASELDPLSVVICSVQGTPWMFQRKYEQAIQKYLHALSFHPKSGVATYGLATCLEQQSDFAGAIEAYKTMHSPPDHVSRAAIAGLGYVYAISGDTDSALAILDDMTAPESVSGPYRIATVHAGLGDTDAAIKYLKLAYESHDELIVWIKVDPKLDLIRSDPRFIKLLSEVGLQD